MPFPLPLHELAPDPIYGLQDAFAKDLRKEKINLSVGVVPGSGAPPFLFEAVDDARKKLLSSPYNFGYLPITGSKDFLKESADLLGLGDGKNFSYSCVHTLGGTGALYLAALFLRRQGLAGLAYGIPAWPNYRLICERAGLVPIHYPYLTKDDAVNEVAMVTTLNALPDDVGAIFQMSCHNPTGLDISQSAWINVLSGFEKKPRTLIFDLAYLGFGKSWEEDLFPFKEAIRRKIPCWVALSFSKSLALYGERVGALLYCGPKEEHAAIASNLAICARATYSSPPKFGAILATSVLSSLEGKKLWKDELEQLSRGIKEKRFLLAEKLKGLLPQRQHMISTGSGLFTLLPLSQDAVRKLREEYAIYVNNDGRINIAALNEMALDRLVKALHELLVRID
jgi:aromatic-amino-acid transaminase